MYQFLHLRLASCYKDMSGVSGWPCSCVQLPFLLLLFLPLLAHLYMDDDCHADSLAVVNGILDEGACMHVYRYDLPILFAL